jgi:hypothetical protein
MKFEETLLEPNKFTVSIHNFTIEILHFQDVSIFHRKSSWRPYINYLSPGNDLRNVETSNRCNVSILKLYFEIVYLNGNNKYIYNNI